jgi:uncharacterized protein YndB with AHSA1/START domain
MATRSEFAQSELAQSVRLPPRRPFDPRGPTGPWIDYFRAAYADWAHPSDLGSAHPEPWPQGFQPGATPVFAHNEVSIAAPAARVFAALLDAERWPTYYENASRVRLPAHTPCLGPGVRFRFTTFGVAFDARVTRFEADRALAWTCSGGHPTLTAHHRWLLEPDPLGTRLVTEETNFISSLHWLGPVHRWFNAQLARSGTREALPAAHQRWLLQLKQTVELPPA